jgi:environmental stress-induced protein Ves
VSEAVRVLRARDHRRMAWANGGGTTYEVTTWPAVAGLDAFDWRISLADIDEGGPFSAFPGIDRTLVLVDGDAMVLDVDGVAMPLARHDVVRFAGEQAVSCTLTEGPTRDLNVMTRRGRCTASVEVVQLKDEPLPLAPADDALAVICLEGLVRIDDEVLAPRDVALVASSITATGTGVVVVVRLRHVD